MSLLELIEEKRPEILRIAAKHGANNLRLFGSVVRGEDHEGSDVDLLAETPSFHERFALEEDLRALLGVGVDVMETPHPYMRDRILEEAIPLDAPDFRERAVLESQRPHVPLDRDATYLRLMSDYCNDVVEMASEITRETFLTERLPQRGLVMTLILIGENAAKVSQEFRKKHSEIPWNEVVAPRNTSVRNYPGLELTRVWDEIIPIDVPRLKAQLERLR